MRIEKKNQRPKKQKTNKRKKQNKHSTQCKPILQEEIPKHRSNFLIQNKEVVGYTIKTKQKDLFSKCSPKEFLN